MMLRRAGVRAAAVVVTSVAVLSGVLGGSAAFADNGGALPFTWHDADFINPQPNVYNDEHDRHEFWYEYTGELEELPETVFIDRWGPGGSGSSVGAWTTHPNGGRITLGDIDGQPITGAHGCFGQACDEGGTPLFSMGDAAGDPVLSFGSFSCPDDLFADAAAAWDGSELSVLVQPAAPYDRVWDDAAWLDLGYDPDTVPDELVGDDARPFGATEDGSSAWYGLLASPEAVAEQGPLGMADVGLFVRRGLPANPYGSWAFGVHGLPWNTDPGWHSDTSGLHFLWVRLGAPFNDSCRITVDLGDDLDALPRHPRTSHGATSPVPQDDDPTDGYGVPDGDGEGDAPDDSDCGFSWTSPTSYIRCLFVPSESTRTRLSAVGSSFGEVVPFGWITDAHAWLSPLYSGGDCYSQGHADELCQQRLRISTGALPGQSDGDGITLVNPDAGHNEDGEPCSSNTEDMTCGNHSAWFLSWLRPLLGLITYGLPIAGIFVTVRSMANPLGGS